MTGESADLSQHVAESGARCTHSEPCTAAFDIISDIIVVTAAYCNNEKNHVLT